jgi:hypothetical protein
MQSTMARQERNSVDYFPYICKEGKAMYYIESKYNNDGFATWVKILRQLAVTNYHYLDLSNKVDMMFLSSKCKVSEEVLGSIITDLVELGEFDKVLWVENKVLWCHKLIDSIQDAYNKRNNECMSYGALLLLLVSLGIRKPPKSTLKGDGNTQSKEDKSKEDNTSKLKIKYPTLPEVEEYFTSNGYSIQSSQKAYNYYAPDWIDSNRKKILNWKQKMRGVWFTEENKKKVSNLAQYGY